MDNRIDIQFISQTDLVNAGCFDIPNAIVEVEKALRRFGNNKIIFPNKIAMIFDEESQSRINCLPGGFFDTKIYGMKWVSVFPNNPHQFSRPNLSAVILLSELTTGFPIAFMDGTLCSNLRTAGISAVAAKYLARKDSKTIGFIGGGEQAKSHFMALKCVLPELKICRVASRTNATEQKFVLQMSKIYPDVEFVACNSSYRKAVEDSDVIITAISGQEKILQADWISDGALYCHVAGLEDDFSVAKKAHKIVCDEWEVVKHRTQTISRMYQSGLLNDNEIYADLHEIVKGEKAGRTSHNEFIYFNTVGLSYIDIALADYMYQKTKNAGVGQTLNIQDRSIFDYDPKQIIT